MKFFLDSADINEITEINKTGIIDGITTNPSLIAKTGQNFIDVISEITNIVNGPISAEVIATNSKEMIQEGQKLAKISP
jgi:Transaldolase